MESIIKALIELDAKRVKLCREREFKCDGCPLNWTLIYGEKSDYDICNFLGKIGDSDFS